MKIFSFQLIKDNGKTSKESRIEFKNSVPEHSVVDLTASCPRCIAAAAEKPGSEGELRK